MTRWGTTISLLVICSLVVIPAAHACQVWHPGMASSWHAELQDCDEVESFAVAGDVLVVCQTDFHLSPQISVSTFADGTLTFPYLRDRQGLPAPGWSVAIHEQQALVALGTAGLGLLDLADPDDLPPVEVVAVPGSVRDVAVAGDLAYVLTWTALRVLDLAAPGGPAELGAADLAEGRELVLCDGFAYVAAGNGGLLVFDISAPGAPVLSATVPLPDAAWHVAAGDGLVHAAGPYLGVATVDIAGPAAPQLLQVLPAAGTAGDLACGSGFVYLIVADAIEIEHGVLLDGVELFAVGPDGLQSQGVFLETVATWHELGHAGSAVIVADAYHSLWAYRESCPVATAADDVPRVTRLAPPRPNPFNPRTVLSFTLPAGTAGRLVVRDLAGRDLGTVWQGVGRGEEQTAVFAGSDRQGRPLPSGTYLFVLEDMSGAPLQVQKAALIR